MSDLKMIKDDPSFDKDGVDISTNDAFHHEVFADTIHGIIKENDPPLSIGLFGGWGVGKTSIINLLKNKLSKKEASFVYFNAWEYGEDSFRRQFLLTIANSEEIIQDKTERELIVKRLATLNHSKIKQKSEEKISISKSGFVKLGIFLLIATIGIYFIIHGGYDKKFAEVGTGIFALLSSILIIIYQRIEQVIKVTIDEAYDPQLMFPEQFAFEFDKLIDIAKKKNEKKKIIIVIDDLDRCDAKTIKSILVTMKTFLGSKKCYFIIPMDDSSVVRIFEDGNHNFGYEQLRKYFNISVRIPEIHFDDLIDFAEKMAAQYKVPADVSFIAALGYCNDARKMKHFLNLYKIKEAIAIERKKKGFLGNLEIDLIKKQLAKHLVLEYQYPEVFKYFSKYPNQIGILTSLAYNPQSDDNIIYKEINEKYENANHLWNNNPGLREFLKRTDYISFDDFDTISKLKISIQEKDLAKLKDILTSGDILNIEAIDKEIFQKKPAQVLQLLRKNFNSPITTIVERCYQLAIEIIKNNYLDNSYKNDLLNEIPRTILNNSKNIKLRYDDCIVFLDNWDFIDKYWKNMLSVKVEEDIFKSDGILEHFASLINHKYFKEMLFYDITLAETIQAKLENDIIKISDNKIRCNYISEINDITFDAIERKKYKLIVPSEKIIIPIIANLPVKQENYDSELFTLSKILLIDDRNPFDYAIVNDALSYKIVEIFANNVGIEINELLNNAIDLIIESPNYLEETSALKIADMIDKNYNDLNEEDDKIKLLVVYSMILNSIDEDKTSVPYALNFNQLVDNLNILSLDKFISQLELAYPDKNVVKEEIVNRKWDFIGDNYLITDKQLVELANYFEKYREIIKSEQVKLFIEKILISKNVQSINYWKDYIIKSVLTFETNAQKEVLDKLLVDVKDSALEEGVRDAYFSIFLNVVEKTDSNNYKSDISDSLSNLIKVDDHILRKLLISKFDHLILIYGEEIIITKVTDLMYDILNKNNIGDITDIIHKILKYENHIRPEVWVRLISKLESDLYNDQLSLEHKDGLLELCKHISSLNNYEKDQLGQFLHYLKDNTNLDNALKGKAWEVYDLLISRNIINPYIPPIPEEERE